MQYRGLPSCFAVSRSSDDRWIIRAADEDPTRPAVRIVTVLPAVPAVTASAAQRALAWSWPWREQTTISSETDLTSSCAHHAPRKIRGYL